MVSIYQSNILVWHYMYPKKYLLSLHASRTSNDNKRSTRNPSIFGNGVFSTEYLQTNTTCNFGFIERERKASRGNILERIHQRRSSTLPGRTRVLLRLRGGQRWFDKRRKMRRRGRLTHDFSRDEPSTRKTCGQSAMKRFRWPLIIALASNGCLRHQQNHEDIIA